MGILNKIFGDKSLVGLDEKINNIVGLVDGRGGTTSSSEDLTGTIINSFLEHTKEDEAGKLFQEVSVPHERLARYNVYDEVYRGVPIIRRIIKTYISNLFPKNPVDGKSIVYREIGEVESNQKESTRDKVRQFSKEVVEHYNIIKKLKEHIGPRKLLYGDAFIEIVSLAAEAKKVDISNTSNSRSVLMDSTNLLNRVNAITDQKTLSSNSDTIIESVANLLVEFEDSIIDEFTSSTPSGEVLSSLDDEGDGDKDKTIEKNIYLNDVLLRVFKPQDIIILETKYGTRLGYIEVTQKNQATDSASIQNLGQVVNRLTALNKRVENMPDKMINKLIFHVLRKIVSNATKGQNRALSDKPVDVDGIVRGLGDDVYAFVKRMFVEQGIYKKDSQIAPMRVRFIPADRMVHFTNSSTEYSPYGESAIESLILPAKLFMLAQLSNAITKLSRASLIRKWTIDTGSTQQHSQLIQRLKRELYNTRVTLNDLGSFKSIPKILSDFKDMFVLSNNGNRQVDVSVESMGDPSIN